MKKQVGLFSVEHTCQPLDIRYLLGTWRKFLPSFLFSLSLYLFSLGNWIRPLSHNSHIKICIHSLPSNSSIFILLRFFYYYWKFENLSSVELSCDTICHRPRCDELGHLWKWKIIERTTSVWGSFKGMKGWGCSLNWAVRKLTVCGGSSVVPLNGYVPRYQIKKS